MIELRSIDPNLELLAAEVEGPFISDMDPSVLIGVSNKRIILQVVAACGSSLRLVMDPPAADQLIQRLVEQVQATDSSLSGDQPLPEDDKIKAAHPSRTGRHGLYQMAMRLVGAKKSKQALVHLVNWLLRERSDLWQLVSEALPYVEAVRERMPDRDSEKWDAWIKNAMEATSRIRE